MSHSAYNLPPAPHFRAGGISSPPKHILKLLLLADIDDFDWNERFHEPVGIVIACGDLSDSLVLEAAAACQCLSIFAVKGNHDPNTPFPEPIKNLHLQVVEFGGIRFGGFNGCFLYKPKGHFLYKQAEVNQLLSDFPPVDVFVSHNSPEGIHDKDDGIHLGFEGIRGYIKRTQPSLAVHGHQHINQEMCLEKTSVVGVYGHRLLRWPIVPLTAKT